MTSIAEYLAQCERRLRNTSITVAMNAMHRNRVRRITTTSHKSINSKDMHYSKESNVRMKRLLVIAAALLLIVSETG